MSNNNLQHHEQYDSFFASEKQTKAFRTWLHITHDSTAAFKLFLLSLPLLVFLIGGLIVGNLVWKPAVYLSLIPYAVILFCAVIAIIIAIKERTFLYSFVASVLISLTTFFVLIFTFPSLFNSRVLYYFLVVTSVFSGINGLIAILRYNGGFEKDDTPTYHTIKKKKKKKKAKRRK